MTIGQERRLGAKGGEGRNNKSGLDGSCIYFQKLYTGDRYFIHILLSINNLKKLNATISGYRN